MTAGSSHFFDWESLVPHLIHPVKVAIIEAMTWIDVPLSSKELDRVFDEELGLSLIAYHVRTLADVGAIKKVRQQSVRGALQSFYVVAARKPMGSPLPSE